MHLRRCVSASIFLYDVVKLLFRKGFEIMKQDLLWIMEAVCIENFTY